MGSSLLSGNSRIKDPSILRCCPLHPVAFKVTKEGENIYDFIWYFMWDFLCLGMENIISIHIPLDSISHLELNCYLYWDIYSFTERQNGTGQQLASIYDSIVITLKVKKMFL